MSISGTVIGNTGTGSTLTGALIAAAGAGAVALSSPGDVTLPLDSKRTYLHVSNSDPALPALPIELAQYGFAPGDRIELRRLGDFDNGPGADVFTSMIGVFSASPVLLPGSNAHRVPGAIPAGVAIVTAPTWFGNEPTDIPEDFVISSGDYPEGVICVVVPSGATHLFVSSHDSLYYDNNDPDGDWGLQITLLDGCAADFDGNGVVDGADLGALLGNWGALTVIGGIGDLNCDGVVNGGDLGMLLGAWGACSR